MNAPVPAAIGHNNPPSPFDDAVSRIGGLLEEARNWADGTAIQNEQQHEAVTALDKMLLDAGKGLEAARKAEVRPIDDAKAAVQARYRPWFDKIETARTACKDLLGRWRRKVEEERQQKALEARREEDRLKAEALASARARDIASIESLEDAEAAINRAKAARKEAIAADKRAATGLGLKTVTTVDNVDIPVFAKWAWENCRAEIDEYFVGLAAKLVRAKIYPAGVSIKTERVPL